MGQVIEGNFSTRLNLDPDKVLQGAEGELKFVMVIGITHDDYDYLAASTSHKAELIMAMETIKHKLLRGDYDD